MLDDLIIYQKTYDFMLWLHPVVNKFPKGQRFILGQRIELKTLDLIHSMIVANAERAKSASLQQASVELDELRILIRLSKDLHFVNVKQCGVDGRGVAALTKIVNPEWYGPRLPRTVAVACRDPVRRDDSDALTALKRGYESPARQAPGTWFDDSEGVMI